MHFLPALGNHQTLRMLYRPESRQVFMGIYNNFLLTGGDTRPKGLLICSANRGEGSTTIAMGMAIAAAEVQSQPVLLIDGNFAQPQVCGAFGLPELYGFGDFLAGRVDLKSVVKATSMPNLQVMAAGVAPLNHISMLEAPAFENLLGRLATAYPLIIVDGPAVNVYAESVLYAAQVDRVFLVVNAGITRVQVVSTALARLTGGGCNNGKVELILNRRTFPIPPWIYKRI